MKEEEVMEYEKQVKALRCCAGANPPGTKCPNYGESGCDNACLDKRLKDAANSIEELMAQVRDKDHLIQQQTDEIDRLRRDVKKQQEKMFDLGKARELKEMEAVKTWCHQRGIAMVDWPIYQSMVACYGRDPMREKREMQE